MPYIWHEHFVSGY